MANPTKKEVGKNKSEKSKPGFWSILPFILALIIFGLIIAFQTGLLDINEFKEFFGFNGNKIPGTCPITSKDTGNECWTVDKENGVRVSGVLTFEWCNCPIDTDFASWDNITSDAQGIHYKICTCKTK